MKVKKPEAARNQIQDTYLACAASVLPLSYDNQTATSPHNLLYVLHRWD